MADNKNTQDSTQNEESSSLAGAMRFSAAFAAAAIVEACFAYTKVESIGLKVALYVVAAIFLLISAITAFAVILKKYAQTHRTNFFLYDRKKRANIDESELTFELVRSRLIQLMSSFKHHGKLYIGDLFDSSFGVPDQFKPLLCYEILYELAADNGVNAETFLSYGHECAQIFSDYLHLNGDDELALNIRSYVYSFHSGSENTESFSRYMQSQCEHIKEKMLGYAIDNIEKFG